MHRRFVYLHVGWGCKNCCAAVHDLDRDAVQHRTVPLEWVYIVTVLLGDKVSLTPGETHSKCDRYRPPATQPQPKRRPCPPSASPRRGTPCGCPLQYAAPLRVTPCLQSSRKFSVFLRGPPWIKRSQMYFVNVPFQAHVSEPLMPFQKAPGRTATKALQNRKHPQTCGCVYTICVRNVDRSPSFLRDAAPPFPKHQPNPDLRTA